MDRQPGVKENRQMARAGFGKAHQGFSLVRGKREIAHSAELGLYTKNGGCNYMRGEISFPPIKEVDRLFGIEPDKSRFRLDPRVRQWLALGPLIYQIQKKTNKATLDLRQKDTGTSGSGSGRGSNPDAPRSMSTIERSSNSLRQVAPPIPRDEQPAVMAARRERIIREQYDRVEDYYNDRIKSAELAIRRARDSGDSVAEADSRREKERLERESGTEREAVTRRFASPTQFRRVSRPWPSQDLYRTEATAEEELTVVINENTPVYRHLIAPSNRSARLKTMVTLMIWAIAYADDDPRHSPEKKDFWDRVRPLIGRYSGLMLSALDDQVTVPEGPSRTKAEVIESISEILEIEKPARIKGSTVPREWLDRVHFTLRGREPTGLGKHQTYISIMEEANPDEDAEMHLSTGATVTLDGYLALEEGLIERERDVKIS